MKSIVPNYPMPSQSILVPNETDVRVRLWATSSVTISWVEMGMILAAHVCLGFLLGLAL
ncbi:hypothetical protein HU675_0038490 [Bradyrhizobium septentrionale]|uniref:hypothetical protein n=1 Tax=Bradyrhizobium septentrionale TaxID=1404411 RepID=UPI001596DDE1|nr:hypothetical protein [Bradyrhizobium septentrionale]UGY23776.1 hypothetical protein HU675_0038490 [Bradyrhizobium septentrionale]